jgi:hypothetical protein
MLKQMVPHKRVRDFIFFTFHKRWRELCKMVRILMTGILLTKVGFILYLRWVVNRGGDLLQITAKVCTGSASLSSLLSIREMLHFFAMLLFRQTFEKYDYLMNKNICEELEIRIFLLFNKIVPSAEYFDRWLSYACSMSSLLKSTLSFCVSFVWLWHQGC